MFLKKNVLSSSIALALVGVGAPAFANDGAIQEVIVEGGLRASLKANMEIKRDDPARRKSFRARHDCANKTDKTKAGYWSCYQWRASAKVDN